MKYWTCVRCGEPSDYDFCPGCEQAEIERYGQAEQAEIEHYKQAEIEHYEQAKQAEIEDGHTTASA